MRVLEYFRHQNQHLYKPGFLSECPLVHPRQIPGYAAVITSRKYFTVQLYYYFLFLQN